MRPAAWCRAALLTSSLASAPFARGAAAPARSAPTKASATAPTFDPQWIEPYFTSPALRAATHSFRLEDWGPATVALTKAVAKLPKGHPELLPAQYLLGLAQLGGSRFDEARTTFEALYPRYAVLAPYIALQVARCAVRLRDPEGTRAWAAKIPAGTVPEVEGLALGIEALAQLGQHTEVAAQVQRYLERFPGAARKAELLLRRGEALELGNQLAEAASTYRRIWRESPTEPAAARAEEGLTALASQAAASAANPKTAAPDSGASPGRGLEATAQDWLDRGLQLFERNRNAEAEAAFIAALAAPGLTPAIACQAAYHRAQSVFKQRQRPRAASVFPQAVTACQSAGDEDLTVKALYQGARCFASTGDRASAQAAYTRIEANFAGHSYADDARLRAAELATDEGKIDEAAALLAEIPKRYPKGDQLGESLWRLAFGAIQKNDSATAHRWLDENLRRIPRETMWFAEGRALYWKARVFDRQKNSDQTRHFYQRAIREYPLSVYALMAFERMRRSFPKERAALLTELRTGFGKNSGTFSWSFRPQSLFAEPGFRRAIELGRLGLGPEARRELSRLGVTPPDSRDAARRASTPDSAAEDIYWLAAALLDRGRVWSASHAIPRYSLTQWKQGYPLGIKEAQWRLAYPRAFPELVDLYGRTNGVPSVFALSIMREESTFNPKIESFANALGLAQMIIPTAQRFSPTPVTRETLLDPNHNVDIGTKFMSFLLDHFNDHPALAIAGYNAGEGAVDRWLKERGNLELDAFLETIPFDETRGYTKRVLASLFAYHWLYEPATPIPALSFSLRAEPRKEKLVGRPPARRPAARRPVH